MTIEIIVPSLGESVTEAIVAKWFKAAGEAVARDEILVELETDKVNLEIPAEADGVLAEIVVGVDESVDVGAVLGRIEEGATAAKLADKSGNGATATQPAAAEPAPPPPCTPAPQSPAVRRLAAEAGIDASRIQGSGKDGRVLKGDVLAAIAGAPTSQPEPVPAPAAPAAAPAQRERREPMSRLRRRIAQRLKQAQNTAAMLTTFNETDMSAVMALRGEYRERFEKRYGVRLGFMSFFVKAAASALKEHPAVNAEIDGDDILYKEFTNIGVAVAAPNGLVVPVLRDADRMSFAEIEIAIGAFGARARDGKLTLDDMSGGTFTISNGGVFGSLLSTPILNAPQSGILGMHKIQKRPVAIGDAVEVRPMMYLALSYDHRIIDGREAVTFLVRIKEGIEDPQRLLLDI